MGCFIISSLLSFTPNADRAAVNVYILTPVMLRLYVCGFDIKQIFALKSRK